MQSEKVLLIVNEPNQNVYLSGRNVATLAINTAHAVQVRGSGGGPSKLLAKAAATRASSQRCGSPRPGLQSRQPSSAAACSARA